MFLGRRPSWHTPSLAGITRASRFVRPLMPRASRRYAPAVCLALGTKFTKCALIVQEINCIMDLLPVRSPVPRLQKSDSDRKIDHASMVWKIYQRKVLCRSLLHVGERPDGLSVVQAGNSGGGLYRLESPGMDLRGVGGILRLYAGICEQLQGSQEILEIIRSVRSPVLSVSQHGHLLSPL